jgi:hypothetical protein
MTDLLRAKTATAVVAALLLVLAGCAGGVGPADGDGGDATDGDATATPDADAEETALDPSGAETDGEVGTVTMYLSDSPIEEFEHLNVTISKVGLKRASGPNGSDGDWVEYDVNDTTADLTELQGPNATSLGVLSAPAGNYTKVFVYVDEVEGILDNGEEVNVKLPSEKLQLTSDFTVAPNSSVQFVFDISVFKAGNSGKYILKPVVSGSGTGDEVEINDVDEDADENGSDADDENESDADDGNDGDADGTAAPDGEDEGDGSGGPPDDAGEGDSEERIAVTALRTPV